MIVSRRLSARIVCAPLLAALCAALSLPASVLAQVAPVANAASLPDDAGLSAPSGAEPARSPRAGADASSRGPVRRVGASSASAAPAVDVLADDLGDLLTHRVRSGKWGAIVVSLTRGDTLYALNPDEPLKPASNMKLFTAAVALDELGAQHQFSTDVLRDGPLATDGTMRGNLYLRGDGDPGLSQRYLDGGPSAPMNLLAHLVAGTGIKHVTGNLIADATAFDTSRVPEGWQHRYLQASYAARVSALSLDENIVLIVVHPGASANAEASVSLDPATNIPVRASVRTVEGRGARVIIYTDPSGNIVARGWIGTHAGTRRYQLVVEHPALFAAGALRQALASLGVTVDGAIELGKTPVGATTVASLPSPPLARLISAMNRESINHFAELLFRDAGRHADPSHIGSVETASALLQRFMTQKVGAAPDAVHTTDGCGLSVLDYTTPRALVQLLAYANHAPWSDAFHASLPVAGESELLRDRMRYTPAQGNLHAKTGTTNTVISLAGYVTARDGEILAFAFLYNGTDRWRAKETIDEMGARLAKFARVPGAAGVGTVGGM
ncbi:MAG TPA: D-alanyl-D-alanine carboxypeptidase/D-alanyl-D-alanine-endopeptidase [Gemmatimonadaceae bacterium]|nr:D-alanyl-D-alanine carboxypeptidase/D-alanyl-D-alanine-endopeptidase [Gemmatimonadaceae bacterium]